MDANDHDVALLLIEIKMQLEKVHRQGQTLERQLLVIAERLMSLDEKLAVTETRFRRLERPR